MFLVKDQVMNVQHEFNSLQPVPEYPRCFRKVLNQLMCNLILCLKWILSADWAMILSAMHSLFSLPLFGSATLSTRNANTIIVAMAGETLDQLLIDESKSSVIIKSQAKSVLSSKSICVQ